MALSIKKENYNIFPRNLKNKFPFDFEVFPPDERVKVADEKLRPYCWVCKIQVRYIDPTTKTGGWSEGTGILIRSNYVLTNAHVILGKGKPSTHTVLDKIVVTIGLNNTNKIAGLFETKTFRIHPNFGTERANPPLDFDSANSIWDYGVIRIGDLSSLTYWGHPGSTSLIKIDKECIYNSQGRTAGYKPSSSEMIEAIGTLSFLSNIPSKFADRLLAHNLDTEHGQSGSPIWIEALTDKKCKIPILAGIHVIGNKSTNIGIRITNEVLININNMIKQIESKK